MASMQHVPLLALHDVGVVSAVFTLVTRGRFSFFFLFFFFFDVGIKLNIEPNGGIFDVSPENDRV